MGRPKSLERFVSNYHKTKCTLPVHIVLDADDAHHYESVDLPIHFKTICAPACMRLGAIYNAVFKTYPNESFYGMVSDDVIPETDEWDVKLAAACKPDKMAWPNDGFAPERMPTSPFLGGELVRKLGFWSPGDMQHWYTDNAWADIAYGLGKAVYCADINLIHYHPVNGNAPRDATYTNQPNHSLDKIAYDNWKRNSFPSILERMK